MRWKAPRNITSARWFGRSNTVTRTVSDCQTPKCLARHVTSSPRPMSPDVTPAIARSPDLDVECACKSMLRDKSKTLSIGAVMGVVRSMTGIILERATRLELATSSLGNELGTHDTVGQGKTNSRAFIGESAPSDSKIATRLDTARHSTGPQFGTHRDAVLESHAQAMHFLEQLELEYGDEREETRTSRA